MLVFLPLAAWAGRPGPRPDATPLAIGLGILVTLGFTCTRPLVLKRVVGKALREDNRFFAVTFLTGLLTLGILGFLAWRMDPQPLADALYHLLMPAIPMAVLEAICLGWLAETSLRPEFDAVPGFLRFLTGCLLATILSMVLALPILLVGGFLILLLTW